MRSVIVSQNHYLNKILDVHPLVTKVRLSQNSNCDETQIVKKKIENSKCDKTQIFTKEKKTRIKNKKKSNCDKTQNSNCDKT